MAKIRKNKVWLMLLGVAALGLILFSFMGDEKKALPPGQQYTVEKTGSSTLLDFSAAAVKANGTVDGVLKKAGAVVRDIQESNKEIPRQKIEGMIRWHTRQLLVAVPADSTAEVLQQAIAKELPGVNLQLLGTQTDTYQGLPALRLDIGFRDKVAGDDITIISDRIYLVKDKGNLPALKPEGKGKGQMAIVIDDFGYSREPISAFASISRPLTFAVIPYRQFSREAASRGLSSGHQVILHLPMEPIAQSEQSEKLTVLVSMSDSDIQSMVRKAIQETPGLIGFNNHQGSRATADRRVMKAVLTEAKNSSLFFLDSRTNSQSVGVETARQMGVRTVANELFIDNSDDVAAVKGKLRTALDMALRHGSVTVIGHARMNTAAAVSEMIPEIEGRGIQLVFVSQLAR